MALRVRRGVPPRTQGARGPGPHPIAPAGRLDRWTRWATLGFGALLGLLLLVSLTAPRWAELLRQPLPEDEVVAGAGDTAPPAAGQAGAAGAGQAERRIQVKLFLGHPTELALVEEERSIPFSADLGRQVRLVVEALIQGSQGALLPTLPPSTRVLDVFVRDGVAFINLSEEAVTEHEGGTDAELLTVYGIVNTVVTNFPAARRVQLAVAGEARTTLVGHVDISAPLGADLSLLAPAPLQPAGPPVETAASEAPPRQP